MTFYSPSLPFSFEAWHVSWFRLWCGCLSKQNQYILLISVGMRFVASRSLVLMMLCLSDEGGCAPGKRMEEWCLVNLNPIPGKCKLRWAAYWLYGGYGLMLVPDGKPTKHPQPVHWLSEAFCTKKIASTDWNNRLQSESEYIRQSHFSVSYIRMSIINLKNSGNFFKAQI